MIARIYSDGASRGNPGPAAAAFIILDKNGKTLAKRSTYIGIATNNKAEYVAFTHALEEALRINVNEAKCYSDSELLVKQLKGKYRVKSQNLFPLYVKVKEMELKFNKICFVHVPRTNLIIRKADRMANITLNRI